MNVLERKTLELQTKINTAPLNPGCYIYKDPSGKILYIGKAKVIRNRVKSYFNNYSRIDPKIQIMIDLVGDIDFVIADSEIEAFILEANLIKKYKPKYNTMLIDDKYYSWVRIDRRKGERGTKPNHKTVELPTVTVVRKHDQDGAHYFGPYPQTMPVRRTIDNLRKVFPFCTAGSKYDRAAGKPVVVTTGNPKPCFHYHLGMCKGICADLETKEGYLNRIDYLKKFFSGQKQQLIDMVERDMKQAAKNKEFERAAILRNRLRDIKYVTRSIHADADMDLAEVVEKKQQEQKDALIDLVEYLNFPNLKIKQPFRIECYDISNIQGTNAVGAMTVMIDGKADPKLYRKFKIQMKNEPNDFAMMQEILFRRFRQYLMANQLVELPKELVTRGKNWKADESFGQKPDLIVIDGGKGQLSSAFQIMQKFGLNLPMVGLAKREEEVFAVSQQLIDPDLDEVINQSSLEFKKIHLPNNTQASFLLQRIRDEAHRFGITYHRKLRTKQAFEFKDPVKVKKRRVRPN